VSNAESGGYTGGVSEYKRLAQAVALDRKAALESASWGLGQVMGFNSGSAGFANAEDLVRAMCESEDRQFGAMLAFIDHEGLAGFLQAQDWRTFARRYNGPAFEKNKYDVKLKDAHAEYAANGTPDLRARAAQLYLTYLDYDPGGIDGRFGPRSQRALKEFQEGEGMSPASGRLDDATFDRLEKKAIA
jgi:hypothetical protein